MAPRLELVRSSFSRLVWFMHHLAELKSLRIFSKSWLLDLNQDALR